MKMLFCQCCLLLFIKINRFEQISLPEEITFALYSTETLIILLEIQRRRQTHSAVTGQLLGFSCLLESVLTISLLINTAYHKVSVQRRYIYIYGYKLTE